MRKLLLAFPLLLVSCTNSCIYNVDYNFNYDRNSYLVVDKNGKEYYVSPKNYYEIRVHYYKVVNGTEIHNKYYVGSKELYVFVR